MHSETGQVCEGCFLEKDGGERQEKNGPAKEKTPHRWWRYIFTFIHVNAALHADNGI